VARLLDDVADVMVDWPEATIEVRELRAECGGLAADLSITAPASGAAMATGAVEVLVEKARRASELTCSICGGPGSVRSAQRRYAALCDSHFGGWVARHGDRDVETGRGWRETADREVPRIGDGRPTSGDAELGHRLYDPADVRAALGLRGRDVGCLGPTLERPDDLTGLEIETNHQNYLHTLLDGGEAGCLRTLAHPDLASLGALDGLEARAPHMAEVTEIVRRHVRAALAIGLPTSLPALMLLGGPGTGKSWFLSRLASVLAIPHRRHPMNGQSLADGLSGSHPTWRNAQPGLVARCLLAERIANPLVLIDEVDKAGGHHVEDPYRALYDLLEPEGARTFVDEYLQFPIDASRVLWVLAGNDIEPIPAAILDRLTIIAVPTPDEGHLRAVAASVYEECNAVRRSFFPAAMGEDVLERLLGTNPRGMRKAIAEAMTRAAADGRGALRADDVVVTLQPRRAIGFR
jgi:ATP-dependent Lon protease